MGNRPEKRFKCGAVEASLFSKEIEKNGRTLKIWNVVTQKWYLSATDGWKTTNRYDANELPKLMLVSQEAYRYIGLKEFEGNRGFAESNENE